MNVKLLRKVKRHILAVPRRFVMSEVIMREENDGPINWLNEKPFPDCGTAACVAGWACLLANEGTVPENATASMDEARELLGLTDGQADRLFMPSAWPKKFQKGTDDSGTKATAKVAAARIEYFIKNKGTR